MSRKVSIARLASGVPGLDAIRGGGIPAFSSNLVVWASLRQDDAGGIVIGETPTRVKF